jgi:allophanate hydrolase
MIMPTAGGSYTREQVREDPIATNSRMGLYTNHCNLLDLAAVAIPENSTDMENPFGITLFGRYDSEDVVRWVADEFLKEEMMELCVCGLHKKSGPLEYQLTELGARFLERTKTTNKYKLYQLHTNPVKPGLVKAGKNGRSIEVDVYRLPAARFGKFLAKVSEPLVIGDVELQDGRLVKGFLCQEYAVKDAEEISFFPN